MKVAGFTFIRNAIKYDYPVVESITSLLPLVDEMVVAVGNSDDGTRALIEAIPSHKIRIINTVWDENIRTGGAVLAVETNKAFAAISAGVDWAFYLQADEVIHEKDYDVIRTAMKDNLTNKKVDGLLFKYIHFYGNYNYVGAGKQWYKNEIRIIRNNKNITSYRDAQGFRFGDNTKLKVKKINAYIYHYGWVKHPTVCNQKSLNFTKMHNPGFVATAEELQRDFDYHRIDRLLLFNGTHPHAIAEKIKKVNWIFEYNTLQSSYANMKLSHKISFFIEDITGYRIGEYKNYKLVR